MKTIPLLLFLGFTISAYCDCIFTCTTTYVPGIGLVEDCQYICDNSGPDPTGPDPEGPLPDLNPEPSPGNSHACGSQGVITNFEVTMTNPFCTGACSPVKNPSTGRWKNAFMFSGRISRTFGASSRIILSANMSPNSVEVRTFNGAIFSPSIITFPSQENRTFSYEVVAQLDCNSSWEEIDRESGSVDLKGNGNDFDRQLGSSNVLVDTQHILRVNTCAGGFHTITQTHTRTHSFELTGTIQKDRVQAKYGWSDTTSISQGTRVNLPNHKCDIELDTLVDTYSIYSWEYDWLGSPSTSIYSGRVLIKKLQISTPTFGTCN